MTTRRIGERDHRVNQAIVEARQKVGAGRLEKSADAAEFSMVDSAEGAFVSDAVWRPDEAGAGNALWMPAVFGCGSIESSIRGEPDDTMSIVGNILTVLLGASAYVVYRIEHPMSFLISPKIDGGIYQSRCNPYEII